MKDLQWVGSSFEDIKEFPKKVLKEVGYELDRVQKGLDPNNWKPFNSIGSGVKEIRIRDTDGIYRVIYIAKFEESVYILHCFQKHTQTTSKQDKKIAQDRYKDIIRNRS
jgi:phage-related protein